LARPTLTQVVRDQRENLMGQVRKQLSEEAKSFGIEVVDVRIRRADLPEQKQSGRVSAHADRASAGGRSVPRQGAQKGQGLKPAPTAM